jgi:hypothetical protein
LVLCFCGGIHQPDGKALVRRLGVLLLFQTLECEFNTLVSSAAFLYQA